MAILLILISFGGTRPTLIINPPLSTTDSYIGYYADIDDDGTVDGVIYADLAHAKSGQWNNDSWSGYSYEAVTNGLKEYYIKGEHTEDNNFGTKLVIAPVDKNDTRKDRFYVMALEDINPGEYYYWYYAAVGKPDKIVDTSYNDFGEGRENTEYVMEKWKNSLWGTQNNGDYLDMWGIIEEEVGKGWSVPSKAEWSAFGDAFKITSSNYKDYRLSVDYWSSSELDADTGCVYAVNFSGGHILDAYTALSKLSIRLGITF